MIRALSALVDRLRLASRLGLQFGGKRDLYKIFGYPTTVTPSQMTAKYIRQDIAHRIVTLPARATWFPNPKIEGIQGWEEYVEAHNVWNYLYRADKLCALGAFAIIYISDDGSLQVFGESHVTITRWDNDPRSLRFGLPLEYSIRTHGETGVSVPYTNVLHIVEDKLENDIYGTPRLMLVYNLLEDLMKVVGGSAETYWLTANRGMQVDVDKDMVFTEEDAKALSDELDEYINQLRRVIRTRGVNIKNLGSDVPDPKNMFDVIMTLIAAATGIPKRILLGAEAGQLASTEDRVQWGARIKERRANFAENEVLKPLLRHLINRGLLEGSMQNIQIKWEDPVALTPLERAQIMAQQARAAINLSKQVNEILTQQESRQILGFDND